MQLRTPHPLVASGQTGWSLIEAGSRQLAMRFRDANGKYAYGYHQLDNWTPDELTTSILIPDPPSNIQFAIIDCREPTWRDCFRAACRFDADFYILENVTTAQAATALQSIMASGFAAAVCIGLPITAYRPS